MKVRRAQQYVISIDTAAAAPAPEPPGWWEVEGQTCVAAYQPKGAASLAASYVNLANPGTNDAAPGTAPTFDAGTGWTFDGAQYLTTGIAPGTSRTYTIIVRFSGATSDAGGRCILGSLDAGTGAALYMSPRYMNDTTARYQNGFGIEAANGRAAGVIAVAGNKGYMDGSDAGDTINTGLEGNLPGMEIARRAGAAANIVYAGNIQAAAIYSTTLSAGEISDLTDRMAAL